MDRVVHDVFPATVETATSTVAAAFATGAAAASASSFEDSSSHGGGNDDRGECRLLGSFALFVQLALGALALLSLVFKRWRERPQRPLKIWFFDASKQVFGSVLVHMANVFMSMLTSGRFSVTVEPAAVSAAAVAVLKRFAEAARDEEDGYTPNPCSFYLLNLAIDTTVGIPILILLLRFFTYLVSHTPLGYPPESIQSGNYGAPPKAWWWLKQSLIYFCGLFGMKSCVLIIFIMFPWISRVGDWALGWTEGDEKVQIVFVMMLFPLIMNALQYYVIDSFIKKQADKGDTEGLDPANRPGSNESGTNVSYQRIPAGDALEEDVDAGADEGRGDIGGAGKSKQRSQSDKSISPVHEEYDPERDGDRLTAAHGSSKIEPEGASPRELLPKE